MGCINEIGPVLRYITPGQYFWQGWAPDVEWLGCVQLDAYKLANGNPLYIINLTDCPIPGPSTALKRRLVASHASESFAAPNPPSFIRSLGNESSCITLQNVDIDHLECHIALWPDMRAGKQRQKGSGRVVSRTMS
jgi:hypothetical protein